MRRVHSARNHVKQGSASTLGADDLGTLKEYDESKEDVLRRQLLEKERENDKLQFQIQTLQDQLKLRPVLEDVQALEREHKNLELLLQGTQRENERCMSDLERSKSREKMLERELERLAGPNWQNALNFQSSITLGRGAAESPPNATGSKSESSTVSLESTIAHIEQVKLMVLGMEQRLETREAELANNIRRAQAESNKFEDLRKQVLIADSS